MAPKPILGIVALVVFAVATPSPAQSLVLHRDRHPIPSPTPPRPAPMDLRSYEIDASIRGEVVSARLAMTWFNPNPFDTEGVFVLPLPPGAAVNDFRFSMNGEMVRGEVLGRDQARSVYEEIVRRQRDPALLEYVDAGLFRASLFPLPARKESRIELRYDATVPAHGGLLAWRHPLGLCGGGDSAFDLRIRVDVEGTAPIQTVYSPSHRIEVVTKDSRHAVATYEASGPRPEGDFLLYVAQGADEVGLHLLTHRVPGEDGSFLLFLAPPQISDRASAAPKDLVFVLDTSGSMEGEKIRQAKDALRFVVRKLNPKDRFGLIAFATEPRPLASSLLPAGEEEVARACAFIDGLEAVGGTNVHDALLAALGMRSAQEERPLYVVFLTDGKPTVGERDLQRILEAVRAANRARARLFVFGVGNDVNTFLLDRLAEENRGSRDYVVEGEDIEVKVSSLYGKIAYPALEEVTLTIEGISVHHLAPSKIGDLFHGTRVIVAGRYDGSGNAKILLRGRASGADRSFTFRGLFPAESAENTFIPRVWAMRRVGALLDEIRLHGANDELIGEVVRLGKKYAIVTPYTSALVQEDESPVAAVPETRERLRRLGYIGPGAGFEAKKYEGADAVKESRGVRVLRDAEGYAPMAPRAGAAGGGGGRVSGFEQEQERVRHRGGKTFLRIRGTWFESELDPEDLGDVVEIAAFSDAYFELVRLDPRIARWLSVGTPVVFRHEGRTYRILGSS